MQDKNKISFHLFIYKKIVILKWKVVVYNTKITTHIFLALSRVEGYNPNKQNRQSNRENHFNNTVMSTTLLVHLKHIRKNVK